ncbi:MAG: TrkA C-terminal domain-containing protein [Ignavibacteria bacterium]|jgi:putative transport protein
METFLNPYIAFFIIVGLGIALGNISIKGISFDSSAVIFVAFLFGYLGVEMPEIIQKLGLIFFIYSVGIQAGPGFFESFKKQGLKLIILSATVVGSAALLAIGFSLGLDIPIDLAVGIFTGALTSTPGLAAAIDSTKSTVSSIGYGIAYPFGVLGVILFVKVIGNFFKVDYKKEENKYTEEIKSDFPQLVNKNYVVENPNIFGKTVGELKIRSMTNTNISRVFQYGNTFTPTASTVLNQGDIIKAVGTENDLKKIELLIGKGTDQKISLGKKFIVKSVLVTKKDVVNKSFAELSLFTKYNATATSIRRSGIDIAPTAHTKVKYGDKIMIACAEEDMKHVADLFGDNKKHLVELDFFPISVGIILGVLIGMISIPLGSYSFKLGLTGGILISSLILSKIGKTGRILWNVAGESNQLLRKLGLIFFLTAVGTNAGQHIETTLNDNGYILFIVGIVITIIPMIIAVLLGHYVYKINFLTLIGALTGSMTSTPALSSVDSLTDSNAPKVAYATVYPFALVLLIIFTQIMVKLF